MAITRETLRLVQELRRQIDRITDDSVRDLTAAWVRAWDTIAPEMLSALEELLQAGDGQWPTRALIQRSARTQRALELIVQALSSLAGLTNSSAAAAAAAAVQAGAAGQGAIIASQLPAATGAAAATAVGFAQAPAEALAAIVNRTTQRITALSRPISAEATDAIRRELIRGMAVGDNPRETARRMLRRTEGEFNGGLSRAANIARTETLDAYRAAAKASQDAAARVLDGWVWHSRLDGRSCPSCWAMHGTVHPLDEPGPLDHQSGRCARVPKTRSWVDLGFDVDEPDDLTPDAQAVFRALPRDQQARILGTQRLELLDRGDIAWPDLARRRTTTGWRDSYAPTPVRDLVSQ